MELIDAHCHLEEETYGAALPQVLARARAAGLVQLIAVGASRVCGGAHEAVALASREASIYATVGIHPHDALVADQAPQHLAAIEAYMTHPRVVGVGEVGLDYHYGKPEALAQQRVLRAFLAMAQRHAKPYMLHIREAHADCYAALDALGSSAAGGMIHCFTAGIDEARAYLERGLYLSIPGIVTFKNADSLRAAVRYIPLDRLLVETDSPYLAPVPQRGQRNEPAWVVHTVAAVAQLRQVSVEVVAAATTANCRRLFGLPATPPSQASGQAND